MNYKYFRLYEECYLVNGKEKSCIYDLFNEKVFHVDEDLRKILTLTENNKSFDDVCHELNITTTFLEEKLKEAEKFQVGGFYEKPPAIEKVTLHPDWKDNLFFKLPPQINRAFLELSNECDNNCFFCASDRYSLRFRCMGCGKDPSYNNITISVEKWTEYMKQLYALGVTELYITGGNVFLDVPKLKAVILSAKEIGFRYINVISGNRNINALRQLGEVANGVKFIIQRYLDENYKQLIESDEIIQNIDILDKSEYCFVFLLDYYNKSLVNDIAATVKNKIKQNSFYFDYLLDNQNLTDIQLREIKFTNSKIKLDDFSIKGKYNPCLNSTVTIKADGIITTCPGLKDYPLSKTGDLYEAIKKDNITRYSSLGCNDIEPCNKCEYRYLCSDCRYIEIKNGAQLNQTRICDKCMVV